MKIGIIVHSQTGHTLSVAEKVQNKLAAAGHAVSLERLIAAGDGKKGPRDVKLQALPDVTSFDAVIFAGPVLGFNASPEMIGCLSQLPSLQGKKLVCFVTESFPFPWMGGNSAIARMKALCAARQGKVDGTWVVNWSNRRREEQIAGLVEGLGKMF